MSREVTRINPLDLKKIGIGINIPFNSPGVFSKNYTTREALKNNIINYFLTNKGERYDNPEFGGGLRKYIFEQLTTHTLDEIRDNISSSFNVHFPAVILQDIDIITYDNNLNKITIKISYYVPNTDIKDFIELNFT